MMAVDDAAVPIGASWKHQTETTFKTFAKRAPGELLDTQLYPVDTSGHTYTESTTAQDSLRVSLDGTHPRVRIFGVQRPSGGTARVVVDPGATTANQYLVSTYGEYMKGKVLLFDSGPLPAGPHVVRVYNWDGKSLSIDGVEVNDPKATLRFE
jgi:hypothetical protein